MRRRQYPLDPLRNVREESVRARTEELGRQIERRQSAEQACTAAEIARQEREDGVREEQRLERERLEQGALRAVDLEAEARWALGEEQRLAALRDRERRRAEELGRERLSEGHAQ
ncbi:MAG TPA: hypothetical protein VK524_20295, partial [Polyangiaceae bacterium]|nr:hypothetical protein [Polyangiaceae bacterium]